jgi:site-specific recombinase XerD
MEAMFGGQAERAWRGASEQLKGWCEAFEGWLEERGAEARKQRRMAWRGLLQEQGKMPWELTEADIEAHARYMREKGYAETTIGNRLGMIASFYRWCERQGVEQTGGEGFNPARGVRRPKVRRQPDRHRCIRSQANTMCGVLVVQR